MQNGFREFGPCIGKCRFDDCRHLAEPECAVKSAVDNGDIIEQRYRSYVNLLELTESLQENSR